MTVPRTYKSSGKQGNALKKASVSVSQTSKSTGKQGKESGDFKNMDETTVEKVKSSASDTTAKSPDKASCKGSIFESIVAQNVEKEVKHNSLS